MIQEAVAYALVAFAGAWVVWSVFLPSRIKAKLKGRVGRAKR